jgi:hypothetical protein
LAAAVISAYRTHTVVEVKFRKRKSCKNWEKGEACSLTPARARVAAAAGALERIEVVCAKRSVSKVPRWARVLLDEDGGWRDIRANPDFPW